MNKIYFAVCDDDEITCDVVCRRIFAIFKKCGIEVSGAKYFSSATLYNHIAYSREGEAYKYDLVFLDIDMPKYSGMDVAEEILHEAKEDFYELAPHTQIAFNRFRRKYSPMPGYNYNLFGPISEKKTFKTRRHNTWTLEMHINSFHKDNVNAGSVMFVGVPRNGNVTEYLFIWNHGAFIPELLSTHFVQRYKERYLEPNHIDLRGMNPALYFQRKNTDLRRTYFIPNHWTEQDLRLLR